MICSSLNLLLRIVRLPQRRTLAQTGGTAGGKVSLCSGISPSLAAHAKCPVDGGQFTPTFGRRLPHRLIELLMPIAAVQLTAKEAGSILEA